MKDYGNDFTNWSGNFAVNTAAKPVRKLSGALQGLLTFGQFKWFTDAQHAERLSFASELVWFLIDNGNTNENIEFILMAIDAVMNGGSVDVDDRIINLLTGRANCVYEKLESANGSLFKETIGAFIDDPQYNLGIIIGECSTSDTGCTNGDLVESINQVTIIIEDTTQPSLELAATILHEGIHAEIFRYVSRFENNIDPNNRSKLLQLYQFYKGLTNNKNYDGSPVSDAQHVYMAENYVAKIADAIRELDGNKYSREYYMWYGWEGLEEYDFKNRLTPNLETQYNNYQNIVNANTSFNCN